MYPHKIIIIFILGLTLNNTEAQIKSDSTKNVKYVALPIFFKTPELGYSGGLSATASFKTSFYNDSLTRNSIVQALGFFTSRHVNAQALNATIFFPKEKNILSFQTTHQYFPDKFWGLGSKTQNNSLSNYIFEIFNINAHLKQKIAKHLYIGLLLDYQHVFKINYDRGSSFDTAHFNGKRPYEVSGIGTSITYDTRTNNFWPEKGVFISAQLTHYQKGLISDFNFDKIITDARFFHKLFKNQILAMQLYSFQTIGNTPLRDLAALGGAGNLRGIYQGRFRAKCMSSFITEYRYNFYKRFSAVAFGGIGTVYDNYQNLNNTTFIWSAGAGLRFAVLKKEKINLRLDYGYYNQLNNAVYFTITECF